MQTYTIMLILHNHAFPRPKFQSLLIVTQSMSEYAISDGQPTCKTLQCLILLQLNNKRTLTHHKLIKNPYTLYTLLICRYSSTYRANVCVLGYIRMLPLYVSGTFFSSSPYKIKKKIAQSRITVMASKELLYKDNRDSFLSFTTSQQNTKS